MADAALVVLAVAEPLQTAALVVVVVVGVTLAVTACVLTRRVLRRNRQDEPPSQTDDLEPGQR